MATPSQTFHRLGSRVSKRLQTIHLLRWLNASVLALAGALLVMLLIFRLTGAGLPEWQVIAALLALWVTVTGVAARVSRPRAFEALSAWDSAAGGKSVLASAEFFEGLPERGAGEDLHLHRANQALEKRLPSLRRDLPLPKPAWSWLSLLLVAAFAISPLLRHGIQAEDALLTEDMQERAKAEAEELAKQREKLAKLESLTDAEKERLKKLGEALDSTVENLGESSNRTSKELLEELEARAREAEKMAEELGAEDDAWASEEMLKEMSQHADTADLAAAIRDKDAELSAEESEEVGDKLDAPELPKEVEERVETALTRTMDKATSEDTAKPVGQHVGAASSRIADEEPKEASEEFRKLAEHFRDVERREKVKEDLQKLAEQLRQSGNEIAQSQLEQMKGLGDGKAGQNAPQGMQNLAQMPSPMQQQPGQQPQGQGTGQQQTMMAPGPQNQTPQGQSLQAPVPGTGQQQQPGQGQQQAMVPGQQPGQQPGQGLSAPVPGQAPGGQAPGSALGGTAAGGNQAGGTGLQAGHGTAQMGTQATESFDASKDGVVDAQINQDGESIVTQVEGGVRNEQAQRQSQAQAADFISVEEEALDEKALPASRKDEVLRYFTALRERFEDSE